MKRFIEGASWSQSTLFPEYLEDWVGEDNPVRVIDVFVDELDSSAEALHLRLPQPSAIKPAA
jgi:transposase